MTDRFQLHEFLSQQLSQRHFMNIFIFCDGYDIKVLQVAV
jgi:hypothetical protein